MTISPSTSSVSSNNNSQLFMLSNKEFDECKKTCKRIRELIHGNRVFKKSFIEQSELFIKFKHFIYKTSTLEKEKLKREKLEWNVITLPYSFEVLKNKVQKSSSLPKNLERALTTNKCSEKTEKIFSDIIQIENAFDSLVKILEEGKKNAAINQDILARFDFS